MSGRQNGKRGLSRIETLTLVGIALLIVGALTPPMLGRRRAMRAASCEQNRTAAAERFIQSAGQPVSAQAFTEFLAMSNLPLTKMCPDGGACSIVTHHSGTTAARCEIICSVHTPGAEVYAVPQSRTREETLATTRTLFELADAYLIALNGVDGLVMPETIEFGDDADTVADVRGYVDGKLKTVRRIDLSQGFRSMLDLKQNDVGIAEGRICFLQNGLTGEWHVDYAAFRDKKTNTWAKCALYGEETGAGTTPDFRTPPKARESD